MSGISSWREATENPSQIARKGQIELDIVSKSAQSEPTTPESDLISKYWRAELSDRRGTANLNRQSPKTLFFLSMLIDRVESHIDAVYVENLESGRTKHWVLLNERDFDAMNEIYDLEREVLERFPETDVTFRVTTKSEGGTETPKKGIKIYGNN